MWNGKITWAVELSFKLTFLFNLFKFSSSSNKTLGSTTHPLPIITSFSSGAPEGINLNLYLIPSALMVCPALFPPLNLTTISAFWAK